MRIINRDNAKHYNWKEVCDGWHFVESDELSVIAEKMPPNTSEDTHYHNFSRQFFYILSGEAKMRLIDSIVTLKEGTGIEVEPKEIHQMVNESNAPVEFIVISMPKSHGDKQLVEFE